MRARRTILLTIGVLFVMDAASLPHAQTQKPGTKTVDDVPALMALAQQHTSAAEAITDGSAASVAARRKHLEIAATNYRRAVEVGESMEAVTALVGLIRVLDASHLNRPADVTPVARAAIKKYPDNAGLVLGLLQAVLPTPEAALDAARIRAAREALPATPQAQHALAFHLLDLERRVGKGTLTRDSSRQLLGDAVAAVDAVLKARPNDYEAMMLKVMVLTAQVERVEQDPARIKALKAEADRLSALAAKLMKRWPSRSRRSFSEGGRSIQKLAAPFSRIFLTVSPTRRDAQ